MSFWQTPNTKSGDLKALSIKGFSLVGVSPILFCCHTRVAVLIEPVVEGVAATGFLFFLAPTQYYQQSGDSTQEVSSWNLKMKHNRPFTPIYLVDSD